MNKFYLSATIPYVNADPHIGHALEWVQADAKVRQERLLGNDVYFLAGTDENSLKNVQAAEKVGKEVLTFVNEKAFEFIKLKETLNLSYNDFIRTTEKRHITGAQKFWTSCKSEDIYKKKYRGLYCVGCEVFYVENELIDGLCAEHKKAPEVVEEENYFFKLSNYQAQLEQVIENDIIKVYPEHRKNETLAFIKRGLEDFSISRSFERAHGWGVPVPGDQEQIMYVWFDALSNYITALDFEHNGSKFNDYWNQGEVRRVAHVLGKGVTRFHLVYWVAMLLSAGIKLPTEQFVHAYLTVDGEKISKSLGNVINPHDLVKKYSTDSVRYFFLGAVSPAQDGDYSDKKLEEYYTAHLSNGIGNLTSRVVTMLEKYSENTVPKKAEDCFGTAKFWSAYNSAFENYRFDEVVKLTQDFVGKVDELISLEKPWEKVKSNQDISGLLYQLAEALRNIAVALLPIIPNSAEKIMNSLGTENFKKEWGGLENGGIIEKAEPLFPRLQDKYDRK